MIDQLTFERALAHRKDPETSRQAARRMVESERLSKQQKAVLEIMRKFPKDNFTPYELAGGFNALYFAIERRKNELCRKGLIIKTGEIRNGREVYRLVR